MLVYFCFVSTGKRWWSIENVSKSAIGTSTEATSKNELPLWPLWCYKRISRINEYKLEPHNESSRGPWSATRRGGRPLVEDTRLLTTGVIVLTLDGMFAELFDTIYCWAVRPHSGYEHCTTPTTSTSTANHIEPLGFQSHWTDLFDFINTICSQRWYKALWRWISDMARCRIYVSSLCMSDVLSRTYPKIQLEIVGGVYREVTRSWKRWKQWYPSSWKQWGVYIEVFPEVGSSGSGGMSL